MADRDRRAFISAMGTAAPRHFPLLWADHARCQKPVESQHSAHGAPRHRVACRRLPPVPRVRARTEPEKIRVNPLISLNSVPEMQQIAAKTPRRPPKFPANREIFAI